jgi:hypothetical protein
MSCLKASRPMPAGNLYHTISPSSLPRHASSNLTSKAILGPKLPQILVSTPVFNCLSAIAAAINRESLSSPPKSQEMSLADSMASEFSSTDRLGRQDTSPRRVCFDISTVSEPELAAAHGDHNSPRPALQITMMPPGPRDVLSTQWAAETQIRAVTTLQTLDSDVDDCPRTPINTPLESSWWKTTLGSPGCLLLDEGDDLFLAPRCLSTKVKPGRPALSTGTRPSDWSHPAASTSAEIPSDGHGLQKQHPECSKDSSRTGQRSPGSPVPESSTDAKQTKPGLLKILLEAHDRHHGSATERIQAAKLPKEPPMVAHSDEGEIEWLPSRTGSVGFYKGRPITPMVVRDCGQISRA